MKFQDLFSMKNKNEFVLSAAVVIGAWLLLSYEYHIYPKYLDRQA